jgi:hemerythrin
MLVDKEQLLKVDLEEMNEVHYEEADIVNNIDELITKKSAGEDVQEDLIDALEGFVTHTEAHFANEQRLMDEYMFPATHCHESEHSAALANIREVVDAYKKSGDLTALSSFFRQQLPGWLDNHIATMDAVTAGFIAQQRGMNERL